MKAKFSLILFLFILAAQLSKAQDKLKSTPKFCNWESPGNRTNFELLGDCEVIKKCNFKYYIKNGTADVTDEDAAIMQAFAAWADVTDLKFTRTHFEPEADITFEWGSTAGGTPGQTNYCEIPRDIIFESSFKWVTSFFPTTNGIYNVFRVAVHEIGHALGLGHSDNVTAIMYASPTNQSMLTSDDISGIQFLHGRKTGPIVGPKYLCVGTSATYSGDPLTIWSGAGGVQITSPVQENVITVKAINSTPGQLSTSYCEKFTIYTSSSKPGSILGLGQICAGEGEGYFTINPVAGATSYVWSASDPSVALNPTAGGTACTITGITKAFTLSVKAKNPCGTSAATTKSISIKKTYGAPCNGNNNIVATQDQMVVDINSETLEATIYPNPTSENLNFDIEGSNSKISVSIYNAATGIKLLTKEVSGGRSVLNVSSLPKGYYVIMINNEKGTAKKTFMRN